jgi:hypothetical protein
MTIDFGVENAVWEISIYPMTKKQSLGVTCVTIIGVNMENEELNITFISVSVSIYFLKKVAVRKLKDLKFDFVYMLNNKKELR